MPKKQRSISIPNGYFEKVEKLFKEAKDVCEELEISSPSELLRVLARLGQTRFLEIVEQVRKTRKTKPQQANPKE